MADQKRPRNVEYFTYFGNGLTTDAGCAWETKSRNVMAKAAFNKKTNLFTSKWDLKI
jgi:hypothetical protein